MPVNICQQLNNANDLDKASYVSSLLSQMTLKEKIGQIKAQLRELQLEKQIKTKEEAGKWLLELSY